MIKQISILAFERKIPVVMTIHSPSREMFECFRDVVVMGMGGVLAYYGPGERAVEYFQKTMPPSRTGGKSRRIYPALRLQ